MDYGGGAAGSEGVKDMPRKPARPCPGVGPRRGSCPHLIRGDEKYCSDCLPFVKARDKAYDQERDQTPERQFLHSTRWRQIRENKLSQDPLCEICFLVGSTVPAVLVHHIDGDELNNEMSNLQSLCNDCHELIHKKERWGKF